MKHLNLVKIYKMTENELKTYTAKTLAEMGYKVTIGNGYVFAKGDFPVLLVAHLDTVHKETPKCFRYAEKGNKISSPQGIGGDDRNGVYSVLEVAKRYNCSVLFCEQEEVGGVGAEKFTKTKFASELKFNYIIEFDRMGSNDAVFYDCDNPEFEDFITKEFYETSYGSFSDISILAPYLGCAAVNLSCGYYKAHTKDEYVIVSEIEDSIEAACNILERTTEEDKFEYIEAEKYTYRSTYDYYGGGWFDEYGEGECYFLIEYLDERGHQQYADVMANNEFEAVGKFLISNPNITYNDIIDMGSM